MKIGVRSGLIVQAQRSSVLLGSPQRITSAGSSTATTTTATTRIAGSTASSRAVVSSMAPDSLPDHARCPPHRPRPRLSGMPTLQLPPREGPRPHTTPSNPHTQLDQQPTDPQLVEALARRIFAL